MTDVEKLILDGIDKLSDEVNDLSKNVTTNTVKIDHLDDTVSKLDAVVRTGNGNPSLVSRTQALEESRTRARTEEGGNVALAKIKSRKELWLAGIAALMAAFASAISLLK